MTDKNIIGRRRPDETSPHVFKPGDYGRCSGTWFACPPHTRTQRDVALVTALSKHNVQEHEGGSITVEPAILVSGHDNDCLVEYHGYLVNGEWREV